MLPFPSGIFLAILDMIYHNLSPEQHTSPPFRQSSPDLPGRRARLGSNDAIGSLSARFPRFYLESTRAYP